MKKYIAEFIGTFTLVFIGYGSAVIAGTHIGTLVIAFAFGLSLLAMVYANGGISGRYVNLTVTVDMLIS
jgi:aquaporin Z